MADSHLLPGTRPKPENHCSAPSQRIGDASLLPDGSLLSTDQTRVASQLSLAHELAAATMPNPGVNSSLAEELGLDFSRDDEASDFVNGSLMGSEMTPAANSFEAGYVDDSIVLVRKDHSSSQAATDDVGHNTVRPPMTRQISPIGHPPFTSTESRAPTATLNQLAQELAATDAFITRLRHLDTDPPKNPTLTTTSELSIERYTSRIIRHLNDTARERESQIRELVSIDKEFCKIEGEIGGSDVLGSLPALEGSDSLFPETGGPKHCVPGYLQPLGEADEPNEGEMSPDGQARRLHCGQYNPHEGVTPASTIPHLVQMRDVTTSLARSLSAMSEYAQENGVATAETGRKIRALKNRIMVWQTEWGSAERSRTKVEQWQMEAMKCARIDGRVIAQEQIDGFAQALADAVLKARAITTPV